MTKPQAELGGYSCGYSQGLNNTRAWLAQLQKSGLSSDPEVSSPFISILKQQLPGTATKLVKVIYL